MRKYLHDYDRMLEQEIGRVKDAQISKKNKDLILKFYEYNLCRNLSKARMIRHCVSLRLIAKRLKKDLYKLKRKDIEKLFLLMMKEKKAVASIETDKEILKCFFKWLNNGKQPACVKWFSCRGSKTEKKLPQDMLDQDDIKKMLKATLNKRDNALIAILWESGARIGEIGGLQIKNISFDKFGCKIIVDGKTGVRPIRLVNSAPNLLEWLNAHPNSEDQQAPVWVRKEQNVGEQLTHRYIMKMLQQNAKRAKINKPINPHHFRHSRATYMAQYLTEAQMKEYFGWVQDSKMAARYVHLSGKQVDNAILRLHGLMEEDRSEDILKREPCPRCKETNDVNNKYCQKCWLPLTEGAAREIQETDRKEQDGIIAVGKLLELVNNNPAGVKQVMAMIQQGKPSIDV